MIRAFGKRALSVLVAVLVLLGSVIPVALWTVGAKDGGEVLKSYNAIEVITEAQNGPKHLYTDNVFSYSEKNLELDAESGRYLPIGKFNAKLLNMYAGDGGYCSHTGAIRNALTNMLFKWDAGTGEGFAVRENKIVTYAGSNSNHAPALTFTAPEAGKVRLYDPNGGDISPALPDNIFYTLDNKDESIGVAIYKNEQKLWPEESEYYVLDNTNKSVTFPDIKDISVKQGDKLHVMIIPIKNSWGYMTFAAQVDYTALGSELPSYSAASVVEQAQTSGAFASDTSWTYTSKPVVLDTRSGMYLPTGKWTTPSLINTNSSDGSINNTLIDQMLVEGTNSGLSSLNGKIYTFVGYNYSNGSMGALTFVAPYSGKIEMSDPLGIGIGTAGKANPFWTMHDKGQKVGVAVYRNNEKIWPADSDYEVLTGDLWSGGQKTSGKTNIDFPNLGTLSVTRGDKIRIALIPLTQNWGYFVLSPRVDYTEVDAIQPEPPAELPTYSSVSAVEIAQANKNFSESSAWIYTVKRIKKDTQSGYNLPYTDWFYPELAPGKSDSVGVNEILGEQMNIPGANAGVAAYNNKVYTYVGSSRGGYMGALTFVAPFSGKIELSDINNAGIGTAGKANPFWTMHHGAPKVGVAIYHNEQKIWPADGDYFEMTGDNWVGDTATYGNTLIAFPDLETLNVKKGDEIRIALLPLTLNWGYFALAPQVDYIEVDTVQPETESIKEYKAVNDITEAIEKGNLDGINWILEGTPCYPDIDGNNVPTYEWSALNPTLGKRGDADIQKVAPNWITEKRGGLTVYNKAVVLNPGSSGTDFAISLTFEAPKSGVVDLVDRTGGMFGSAGIAKPFWTLTENTKVAGLAIYKNDEKLWPADSEYFKLQGQWDSSIKGYNYENIYETLFPALKDIQVNAGDRLRMCVIPVQNTWLYVRLSPQVRYKSVDENSQKPQAPADAKSLESYGAADAFNSAAKAESMENSLWKLQAIENIWSELVEAPTKLGILVNDRLPIMYKPFMMGDTLFPDTWFNVSDTSLNAKVGDNSISLNTGSTTTSGISVLPALAFSVPKTGIVRLHTLSESPGFSALSSGYPYWTLQKTLDPDAGGSISFMIYRNNEKIWPLDGDDVNTITPYQRSIPFPDIEMQVYKGDTIRIVFDGSSWNFVSLSPVVDYLSFNQRVRPANDNPEWSYGDKSLYDFTWEDFDSFGDFEETDDEIFNGETDSSKKTMKKIIRRYRENGGLSTAETVIIIAVSSFALLGIGFCLFVFIRKKRQKK